MALYQRSEQYISETKNASENLKKEIAHLQAAVEGSKFSAHAHYVLEGEGQEEDNVAVKQPKEKKVGLRHGHWTRKTGRKLNKISCF